MGAPTAAGRRGALPFFLPEKMRELWTKRRHPVAFFAASPYRFLNPEVTDLPGARVSRAGS